MVAIARLHTPPEIVQHLDRHVIGQRHAKQRLALAVYNHYMGLRHRELRGAGGHDFGRQHVLLLGPTGVGKTLLVKTLAAFLGVPVAFTAATSLVETGYVGSPVESIFLALLERAGGDARVAEQGIVFLDEFDKLKRARDIGRDVSGEGVQNGLLTLLDGRTVRLRWRDKEVILDSSRILFLCTGAFAGLADVVRARQARSERKTFGFATPDVARAAGRTAGLRNDGLRPEGVGEVGVPRGAADREAPAAPVSAVADAARRDDEALAHVTADDLVRYGFIPELVARFGDIVKLHPLSSAELGRVLNDLPHSPLAVKRKLFELHGMRMQVSDEARVALVERARQEGLGARMLDRVVREVFAALEFELTLLRAQGYGAVRITRSMVTGEEGPVLIPLADLPPWKPPTPSAEELRAGALLGVPKLPTIQERMRERQQRRAGAASEPPPERRAEHRDPPSPSGDGPTLFDPQD